MWLMTLSRSLPEPMNGKNIAIICDSNQSKLSPVTLASNTPLFTHCGISRKGGFVSLA
jgi:hypothetical protein